MVVVSPIVVACVVLGFGFGLVVGVRLLLLWRRTRQWPELALGCFGVTVAAGVVGTALGQRLVEVAPSAGPAVSGLAQLLVVCGNMALLQATRVLFRPRSPAAWAGSLGLSGVLVMAWLGRMLIDGNPGQVTQATVFNAALLAARFAAFGWWGVEACLYAIRARRRSQLGLGDAWVAHRFALWALMGLIACVGNGCVLVSAFWLPAYASLGMSFAAMMAIAGNVVVYLSFYPPAFYRNWMMRAPSG
ncbi:MAG: hypothetical protein MJE66_05525 [Proteobacteria bacterium]|nr:hypothetical protein [Pseudomonadota bacterium]